MSRWSIRRINIREVKPEQNLYDDLAHVVVAHGSMVSMRGRLGRNPASNRSVDVWRNRPAAWNGGLNDDLKA